MGDAYIRTMELLRGENKVEDTDAFEKVFRDSECVPAIPDLEQGEDPRLRKRTLRERRLLILALDGGAGTKIGRKDAFAFLAMDIARELHDINQQRRARWLGTKSDNPLLSPEERKEIKEVRPPSASRFRSRSRSSARRSRPDYFRWPASSSSSGSDRGQQQQGSSSQRSRSRSPGRGRGRGRGRGAGRRGGGK